MITDTEISNALSVAWACKQFDNIQHEISGMQNLLIYTHQYSKELSELTHFLWCIAGERRLMESLS